MLAIFGATKICLFFGLDTVDGLGPCQVYERKREEVRCSVAQI